MKCEGHKTSRGEQLLRRHWEEIRHVHQLRAGCPFFDQTQIIYCAMQLCACCIASKKPISARSRRLANGRIQDCLGGERLVDLREAAALFRQFAGEGEFSTLFT